MPTPEYKAENGHVFYNRRGSLERNAGRQRRACSLHASLVGPLLRQQAATAMVAAAGRCCRSDGKLNYCLRSKQLQTSRQHSARLVRTAPAGAIG